jgi:hypothetical protein
MATFTDTFAMIHREPTDELMAAASAKMSAHRSGAVWSGNTVLKADTEMDRNPSYFRNPVLVPAGTPVRFYRAKLSRNRVRWTVFAEVDGKTVGSTKIV